MTRKFFRPAAAALGLLGGLAAAAAAQPAPPVPPAAPPAPAKAPTPPRQVLHWPGGSLTLEGPEVILRDATATGGSTNVITNSGNGVGNRIVVDNGGAPGVTILRNVRNGVGNSVTVTPGGLVLELPAKPGAAPEHKGRDAKFWTKKAWSDTSDCNVYWCPMAQRWYRYDRVADIYRPLPADYDPLLDLP